MSFCGCVDPAAFKKACKTQDMNSLLQLKHYINIFITYVNVMSNTAT